MNTPAETLAISTTHDALNALTAEQRIVLLKDMALEMDPHTLGDLGRYFGTVAHHKFRGDLDELMRRAG
mgnify:CR=1 FL=1